MNETYSVGPLAALMHLSENTACDQLGITGSTKQQYRQHGMSREVAERRALQAGFHPYEVWPDMAHHDADALKIECACGCGERFIPTRKGHKFASVACKGRAHSREFERRRYTNDPEFRARKRAAVAAYYETCRLARLRRQGRTVEQRSV